jgi:hypothetical protein
LGRQGKEGKERRQGKKPREESKEGIQGRNLSLTLITLTAGVISTTVFEYQNQIIFNMTRF